MLLLLGIKLAQRGIIKMKIVSFILLILFSVSNVFASGVSVDGISADGVHQTTSVESISITSPSEYQVFQRTGTTADISISGTYFGTPSAIEASFNGGAYATIDAAPSGGTYSGILSNQAQGQGTLTVRFTNSVSTQGYKTYIGIGEVFLVTGQSNAEGQGTSNQSYSSSDGFKAAMFSNAYQWKELVDPFDSNVGQVDSVSYDAVYGGSWVLPLATLLMNQLHVPVAFIPCPLSGSGIIEWSAGANHQDRSTLYGSATYRGLNATNGLRANLYWQGEHEANVGAGTDMDTATYQGYLSDLVDDWYTDLGIPTMPVKLQNSSGLPDLNEGYIRTAVANVETANPTHCLTGPDFSDIASDDAYHLKSTAKLQTAADRFYAALVTAYGW